MDVAEPISLTVAGSMWRHIIQKYYLDETSTTRVPDSHSVSSVEITAVKSLFAAVGFSATKTTAETRYTSSFMKSK